MLQRRQNFLYIVRAKFVAGSGMNDKSWNRCDVVLACRVRVGVDVDSHNAMSLFELRYLRFLGVAHTTPRRGEDKQFWLMTVAIFIAVALLMAMAVITAIRLTFGRHAEQRMKRDARCDKTGYENHEE
jgi:hypothetical protein